MTRAAFTTSDEVEARRLDVARLEGTAADDAIGPLLQALADTDFRVRGEAVRVARTLEPRHAVAKALATHLDERENIGLRIAVSEALAEVGEIALPYLRLALDNLDADGRKLCVDACGKIATRESIALLLGALADTNANVAGAAAEALAVAHSLDAQAKSDVIFALVSVLSQADASVTAAALHSLAVLEAQIPRVFLDDAARDPALARSVARLRLSAEARDESSGDLSVRRATSAECEQLATELRRRFGFIFAPHTQRRLGRVLRVRTSACGAHSVAEYLSALIKSETSNEWAHVVEAVTVPETRFFREARQLATFADQVVPYLRSRSASSNSLTVWSGGCASGEEVYTLAMLLLDHPDLQGWRIKIIGTDISRSCIERAKTGVYPASQVRNVDASRLKRHFSQSEDGSTFVVRDHLRTLCHFSAASLLDPAPGGLYGPFDVVFCKNVLFYLEDATRDAILARIHDALAPGGILCLGHSDHLGPKTTCFELVTLAEDLVYRRPFVHHFVSGSRAPGQPVSHGLDGPHRPKAHRDTGNASPSPPHRR